MDSGAVRIKDGSWLVPGPTNIGIVEREDGVFLVDSGNDKEAGRRILKILKEHDWNLKGIINTHSNADHIGGNDYLQRMTGCEVWATRGESAFIATPVLESSFLWGGYPFRELESKFFEAKPSRVTRIIEGDGAEGLVFVPLPGHYFDQTGIITGDGVFFLGDSVFGGHVLEKYGIPYIYDVAAFRESLGRIRTTQADYYVPSHGEVTREIAPLADANLEKTLVIEERLSGIIRDRKAFDDILAELCDAFGIVMDYGQYVLVGNTVRSFLSYLYNCGRASYEFDRNRMYWRMK